MDSDERIRRLRHAAEYQAKSYRSLEDALEQLAAVDRINREEINKTANAASLALRALRTVLAIELGRVILGDEPIDAQVNQEPKR